MPGIMTTETAQKETKTAATKGAAADFAVIATGGKQYVVSKGDTLEVELLGEHKEGDTIEFDQVLMQNDKVGTPTVSGATVKAKYLGDKKGKKISILRFKAKSNRSRKQGHRQQHAVVEITAVK